ncbi:hypothetical protein ASC77_15440 [Nocardioides sp. Root1257]|uniref:DUF3558 family protein n=1 Tax=unclassified Nocardioides TaxID=2615069 RepID=UPI0006F66792|nr:MULTISPECIES: DUF3558 family protein [unclassified Nocardioides]KQW47817.1 hypothetical protein ASC77_15440 [Nocardioides sp. Root1257]KRC45069.1 hypothetical protein ASE24_16390 [Nocardioides sp. Root224]
MAARRVRSGADLDAGVRAAALAALALALGGLAGCSSSDGSGTPSAAESAAANVAWSPCDDLTAASVGRLVGSGVKELDGTLTSPRCTFTPARTGGPAYDVNYLWFDGGLDAALDAMGASGAQLEPIDVAGADAARLVVRAEKSGVLVTGFVQTEGLVQSVNAAQVAPYDEDQVVAGTKALLATLAAKAPTTPQG